MVQKKTSNSTLCSQNDLFQLKNEYLRTSPSQTSTQSRSSHCRVITWLNLAAPILFINHWYTTIHQNIPNTSRPIWFVPFLFCHTTESIRYIDFIGKSLFPKKKEIRFRIVYFFLANYNSPLAIAFVTIFLAGNEGLRKLRWKFTICLTFSRP